MHNYSTCASNQMSLPAEGIGLGSSCLARQRSARHAEATPGETSRRVASARQDEKGVPWFWKLLYILNGKLDEWTCILSNTKCMISKLEIKLHFQWPKTCSVFNSDPFTDCPHPRWHLSARDQLTYRPALMEWIKRFTTPLYKSSIRRHQHCFHNLQLI